MWKFGKYEGATASELVCKILDAIRYSVPDKIQVPPLSGDTGGYCDYLIDVILGCEPILAEREEIISAIDAWCLAGYIPPGASQDLDGSGLSMWGDSQHGEWSVCQGDGQDHGTNLVIEKVKEYFADIAVTCDFGDINSEETVFDVWREAVEDHNWTSERSAIPIPDVEKPDDYDIAECCDINIYREHDETGGAAVSIGRILGTRCACRWDRVGDLVETMIHATQGDVLDIIGHAARELADPQSWGGRIEWPDAD